MYDNYGLKLTADELNWFGDRMNESHTGRVLVPKYLRTKLIKMAIKPMSDDEAKDFLINKIFN